MNSKNHSPTVLRLLGLAAGCVCSMFASLNLASAAPLPTPLVSYTSEQAKSTHDAAMARYEKARMGMFVHWVQWGLDDAWGMLYRNIPESQYRERVRAFKGDKFNAKAIVRLAQDSGMNYITFVAKHHDSFCLWDSAYTTFDSQDYPMHRDFVKELSDACHAAKMPLFIYYSLGLDWTHPDFLTRQQYLYARPNTEEANATAKDWTPERFQNYRRFCMNQLEELATKYDIAGFWFDPLGAELANPQLFNCEEIYAHIRKINPGLLIFNKTGITGSEDVVVGERELASIAMHYNGKDAQSQRIRELADEAWKKNRFKKAEIAVTSQGTWCWAPGNTCLPADKLYGMLQKAANNNANLLLNFGPLPDGSIPDDVSREFRGLGEHIKKDGYPKLNTATWKDLRLGKGETLDTNEARKTAR